MVWGRFYFIWFKCVGRKRAKALQFAWVYLIPAINGGEIALWLLGMCWIPPVHIMPNITVISPRL